MGRLDIRLSFISLIAASPTPPLKAVELGDCIGLSEAYSLLLLAPVHDITPKQQMIIDKAAAAENTAVIKDFMNGGVYRTSFPVLARDRQTLIARETEISFYGQTVFKGRYLLFKEIRLSTKATPIESQEKKSPSLEYDHVEIGFTQLYEGIRRIASVARSNGFEAMMFQGTRITGAKKLNNKADRMQVIVIDLQDPRFQYVTINP